VRVLKIACDATSDTRNVARMSSHLFPRKRHYSRVVTSCLALSQLGNVLSVIITSNYYLINVQKTLLTQTDMFITRLRRYQDVTKASLLYLRGRRDMFFCVVYVLKRLINHKRRPSYLLRWTADEY
jgi:hypothetical protein